MRSVALTVLAAAPLPRLLVAPPLAMMAGFLLFTALHVAAYRMVAPVLPGRTPTSSIGSRCC